MILINVGTNMHVPSSRITAIDPRGGAAVLGDNGVGKTTTLRMLPLFFGHLPSQIVAAGHGQEAMVKFVLPTDASAIVFEYQRGSDAEADRRMAVIRRRADDPDVPFYRLYRSAFRKEIFVAEGRFLSDDETQVRATELEIQTTSKLTTPEYRSVILRTPAASKDKERLRRYALDWSFGPKQLDNLDRVVAAMVKKHINFADIVQVAVGLVQHDLGQGSERAKLNFKQGRDPIERWLRNREACVDAFRLAPSFAELEDGLRNHRTTETRFRACRADVAALTQARKNEAVKLTSDIQGLTQARAAALLEEQSGLAELATVAAAAARNSASASGSFNEANERAQYFLKERAHYWEQQLQELPAIKVQRDQLEEQIKIAVKAQAEASTEYEKLQADARTQTANLCLDQERSKEPHRARLADVHGQIDSAEEPAFRACDDDAVARRQNLDDAMATHQQAHGAWESRKMHPSASEASVRKADDAAHRLTQHQEELLLVQQAAGKSDTDHQAACHVFTMQEAEVRNARAILATAQSELAGARAQLDPLEGTLLASLRASASEGWKRNLAKVINPELLGRDDLGPAWVEDAAETIYGWQVDTGVLAAPEWTDDSSALQVVETARTRVLNAEARLKAQLEKLELNSGQRKGTDLAGQATQARLTVLKQQTRDLTNQHDAAAHRVSNERRDAVALATSELTNVQNSIDDLKKQRQSLDKKHMETRGEIKAVYEKQRREAQRLCDESMKAIQTNITRIQQGLETTLQGLKDQLEEHLSSSGVDVKRLTAMKAEADRLGSFLREREDRRPIVESWKKWLTSGGDVRVEALRAAAIEAAKDSQDAAAQLDQLKAAIEEADRGHRSTVSQLEKRHADVVHDLKILDEIDQRFGSYEAAGVSVVNLSTSANELRSRVQGVHSELSKLDSDIDRLTSTLWQAMTAKNNAVKEFAEASLDPMMDSGVIGRAYALCIFYKNVGPQVANDVNLTLKTLLANIGAFQKAIHAFEREVAAFNRRLQAGLSEVRCFERVKDLRLDIVTNFDGLGFYKKLARMEDLVRQHANDVGKDYTRDLPSDDTARALGEFMSVLGTDGNVELNLSSHITLRGSVIDNGRIREFKRASELENISSDGLTSLILITLMTALLNTIRGAEPVHVPWVTDEVGKFDPKNFKALMQRLRDNRIDVVTASPELGPAQQAMFAHRYLFEDCGRIREYRPLDTVSDASVVSAPSEVEQ